MIVSGAENVYSIEVEDVLHRHPAVVEAAVFGIPDPTWGEAVHAVVVVAGRARRRRRCARGGAAGITAATSIAGYKVPKRIEIQRRAAAEVGARQDPEARAARSLLAGAKALTMRYRGRTASRSIRATSSAANRRAAARGRSRCSRRSTARCWARSPPASARDVDRAVRAARAAFPAWAALGPEGRGAILDRFAQGILDRKERAVRGRNRRQRLAPDRQPEAHRRSRRAQHRASSPSSRASSSTRRSAATASTTTCATSRPAWPR